MKVIIINGSARRHGCTARALREVEEVLHDEGIKTITFHIGSQDIRGCISCHKCQKTGKCVFDDAVKCISLRKLQYFLIFYGTTGKYVESSLPHPEPV